MILNGGFYKNDIINALNNKTIKLLSSNMQNFIKTIFPKIKNNDVITCRKCNGNNINMSIQVSNTIKYISIKTGNTSIVFKGHIYKFIAKLMILDVSDKTINSILKYFKRESIEYSGSLLQETFKNEIEIVKKEFENPVLLSKFIDLLILEENGVKIDFFYYGNLKRGFTVNTIDFKKRLIMNRDNYPHNFMRLGPFNFISLNANKKADYNDLCQLRINNISKFF